ncbi:unnamed protein product [Staurois parvus]|uniref:Uncharacterized protein n=1 Tax=Staurois parvus TaxID=386267 RepID=A0ABN9GFQ2_9NEOB|nr:unnamed protein product [Staurois parvus]
MLITCTLPREKKKITFQQYTHTCTACPQGSVLSADGLGTVEGGKDQTRQGQTSFLHNAED